MIREKAVRFGRSAALVGVVTEPPIATAPEAPSRPGVILLNSGVLHRVGSCRLHVRIARALAPEGFPVLRFDYSGIGDSEPRRDQLAFEESAPLETQEAMDYLASTKGVREFVLVGLCSGADMAHHVAARDRRVVGMVLLDAWAYRTAGFHLRYYGSRIHRWRSWVNWIGRHLRRVAPPAASAPAAPGSTEGVTYDVPKYIREVPPRSRVAAELRGFVERGVELFYVFTGGQIDRYNHRAQHERTFADVDFRGCLRVEYLADADHILTGLAHQAFVVREITAWIARFTTGAATPARTAPATAVAPQPARQVTAAAR